MRLRSRARGISLAAILVAAGSEGCTPDETTLRHGFIKIDPKPLENDKTGSVFDGTTEVRMVLHYEECLRGFYERETSWRQDGVDGHAVFGGAEEGGEGWLDRLCDDPESGQVECEVIRIEQALDMVPQLRVTVRVEPGQNLEARWLKLGPIPLQELAGCRSMMRVPPSPITGFSGSTRIWDTEVLSSESLAEPNQGGAIRVRVKRV